MTAIPKLSYKPILPVVMTDLPTPQMIFWKMGEWRCEYWRTDTQRRLIVFFRGEPLIDQPCHNAESVILRSKEFRQLVETANLNTQLT